MNGANNRFGANEILGANESYTLSTICIATPENLERKYRFLNRLCDVLDLVINLIIIWSNRT